MAIPVNIENLIHRRVVESARIEYKAEWNFEENEKEIDLIKDAVRAIRNVRAEMNVAPSKKATVYVVTSDSSIADIFDRSGKR